jgi:hypothetical protein
MYRADINVANNFLNSSYHLGELKNKTKQKAI